MHIILFPKGRLFQENPSDDPRLGHVIPVPHEQSEQPKHGHGKNVSLWSWMLIVLLTGIFWAFVISKIVANH